MLEGEGVFELWPTPQRARDGVEYEEHARSRRPRDLAPGVDRASRTASARATSGMTFLAYGTRDPNDICYYPRSNKIYFRGLGLIARLEDLDYEDGEPG